MAKVALPTDMYFSEVELIYKTKINPADRPSITCSRHAYRLLKLFWDDNKIELLEQFKIILLNTRNRVLGMADISTGGVSDTATDPRIIFSMALKANASQIIIAHNHPSGDPRPSQQDCIMTKKLVEGGNLLDIKVLDHLIITAHGYLSFGDEGLL